MSRWITEHQNRRRSSSLESSSQAHDFEKQLQQRLDDIEKLPEDVEKLKKKRDECSKKLAQLSGRHTIHLRRDIEKKIVEIEKQIDVIESGEAKRARLEELKPFMERHQKILRQPQRMLSMSPPKEMMIKSVSDNKRKKRKCNGISKPVRIVDHSSDSQDSMIHLLDDFNSTIGKKAPPLYIIQDQGQRCPVCDSEMGIIQDQALLLCKGCGTSCNYTDSSASALGFSEEYDYCSFSYRRINHFIEWIQSFQGRESTEIPQMVLDKVMQKLHERRITDPEQITTRNVRECLKELHYRKYYENVMLITCLISGKSPPRLSPKEETQLKLMFLAIQDSFEKHCPPERKNFLSYSYCLYKFVQILGLNHYMSCFSLLKGKDKLYKQDVIFKKICNDLDWPFYPSV